MSEPIELVTVHFAQGQWEAEIVKARLETNGIPAILRYEAMGRILGVTVDALGRVEVQVASEDADRATDVLGEESPFSPPKDESPDVAPKDES